ncbi:MAG: hypothetical protein LBN34_01655 [Clostridiales Family XIII bacterium]|nr:hypothetical protein [Clostridiales Family XIII bacterium]
MNVVINHTRPILLLIVVFVCVCLAFPIQASAFNGALEDCDFDGYDDETNAPVPWPGFDETRGDAVPSDWDGVAGSYIYTAPTTGDAGGGGTDKGVNSGKKNSNDGNGVEDSGSGAGTGEASSGGAVATPSDAGTGDQVIPEAVGETDSVSDDDSTAVEESADVPLAATKTKAPKKANQEGELGLTTKAKTENASTTFAGVLILIILAALAVLTLLLWWLGKGARKLKFA